MLKLYPKWETKLKESYSGYTRKELEGRGWYLGPVASRIKKIDKLLAAGEAVYMEDGK